MWETVGQTRVDWTRPDLVLWPRRSLVARVRIDLENAEGISLAVDEVTLPARLGHSEFGERYHSTKVLYGFRGRVEVFNLERAHESVGAALSRRLLGGALQQSTARASGFDPPVWDRKTHQFLRKLPSENFGVKMDRAPGIISLDFKVDVTVIHKHSWGSR